MKFSGKTDFKESKIVCRDYPAMSYNFVQGERDQFLSGFV
jgi:hypothetical protein